MQRFVTRNTWDAEIEFWLAHELMALLGYERWGNFEKVVKRAIESCETSGIQVLDHFREVTKMIIAGKGAKRKIKDYCEEFIYEFCTKRSSMCKNYTYCFR